MQYEVFISYKHSDEQGRPTPDYFIAQELYWVEPILAIILMSMRKLQFWGLCRATEWRLLWKD